MAPIKFEENIKDKLEKRTLSPASESWSKLSERLDADEKKSKNPLFWWLSIAAGLIIMIAVSAHFFKSNDTENASPQMVNDKPKVEQLKDKTPKSNDIKSIELANEDHQKTVDKVETEDLPSIKESQIINYKKVTNKKTKVEEKIAEQNSTDTKIDNTQQQDLLNEEAKNGLNETLLKSAVVNALKDLKAENSSVSDREIDSLLKIASKELFKEKLQKQTSKTVDANTLLMSVEDEMGQSFRTRVFEALKESYETVKTAVADRNN